MRLSPCAPVLLFLLGALPVTAQTPTAEQLSILKNLPADQQQQLLQGVLGGKSDGTGRKADPALQTPETVRPKNDRLDQYDVYVKDKTVDGRPLRLRGEDPEIRADDTVLIDLVTIERRQRPFAQSSTTTASAAGTSALNGSSPNNGQTGHAFDEEPKEQGDLNRSYGRTPYDDKPLSDSDKQKIEDFRQRILKNNPYRLNRFGVLELPGIPSIPIAGLTAAEAASRLSADPDLRDFTVTVTLLRLKIT
jgi:polysaccharide biosynthesis/export protein